MLDLNQNQTDTCISSLKFDYKAFSTLRLKHDAAEGNITKIQVLHVNKEQCHLT